MFVDMGLKNLFGRSSPIRNTWGRTSIGIGSVEAEI